MDLEMALALGPASVLARDPAELDLDLAAMDRRRASRAARCATPPSTATAPTRWCTTPVAAIFQVINQDKAFGDIIYARILIARAFINFIQFRIRP